jgi:hypothetical protein
VTEDERDDLIDLVPYRFTIWEYENEIPGWAEGRDFAWWRDLLKHPKAHGGCCATCGCAVSCDLVVYHEAMISSVVRELDKIGALRVPPTTPEKASDET